MHFRVRFAKTGEGDYSALCSEYAKRRDKDGPIGATRYRADTVQDLISQVQGKHSVKRFYRRGNALVFPINNDQAD